MWPCKWYKYQLWYQWLGCREKVSAHRELKTATEDWQIECIRSDDIKCLTLSSFASISTTSVSTSSIFALKNTKTREAVDACVVMCNCTTERNSITVVCLIWKQPLYNLLLIFPTFSESTRTPHKSVSDRWSFFSEPNPDMFEQQRARVCGVALSERDAVPGAAQLRQNKVTDEVSTQRGEHGCLAHPKPQSTDPLSTPPPLMPHLTAPLREVWFTPGGPQLHDVATKSTTPQLLHILVSIKSVCIDIFHLYLLLILSLSASCCTAGPYGFTGV